MKFTDKKGRLAALCLSVTHVSAILWCMLIKSCDALAVASTRVLLLAIANLVSTGK